MKIFQSRHRILAAQINAIQQHQTAPLYQLLTDAETVQVPPSWIEQNQPKVGGYVVISTDTGVASYLSDKQLVDGYELIGAMDLTPAAEQGQPAPEPLPDATDGVVEGPYVFGEQEVYTFDQFVQFGIAAGGNVVEGMPWSFTFHGCPVSHENDDRYIINLNDGKGGSLDFYRGDTLHVVEEGIYINRPLEGTA